MEGFLVTTDIEMALDSLDHLFLMSVLKKISFGKKIDLDWNCNKKSRLLCYWPDKTTQYFKLQEGAQQGDSISAYLFILALAVLFYLIKNNTLIKNLEICDYHFIYSAYTDDTFFKK